MENNGCNKRITTGKKTKGGRRWREKQKKKREEEEEKKRRQILFLDLQGDLVGIDLNTNGNSNSNSNHTSLPPLAPICCRLELRRYGYPFGMRHIKLKDKVYLLGGAFFEPTPHGFHREPWIGYSDKVYDFDYFNSIESSSNNNNYFVDPNHVLRPLSPTLREPKFALVANLRGTFYAFHSWIDYLELDLKPKYPNFSFERFDPATKSWHPAPTPPIYQTDHKRWLFSHLHPHGFYHFVVDDKFLVVCDDMVQVFSHLSQKWTHISYLSYYYTNFSSFDYVPANSLWLSNFDFPYDHSLGVLLFIDRAEQKGFYGFNWDHICKHFRGSDSCFLYTHTVYAYAMCKTECNVKFHQQLDGIFCDMLPTCTPLNLATVGYHLLDLGNQEDNNRIKRICALLTGDGLTNGISYLFISIFDLRMAHKPLASTYPVDVKSYEFLEFSTVKKLVFRLNKDRSFAAYKTNKLWLSACDIPPLNAFLLQI